MTTYLEKLLEHEDFIGVDFLRRLIEYHQKQLLDAQLPDKLREHHRDCISFFERQLAFERKEQA